MEKRFAVYMLASCRNGTLYVGVTSNLPKRVWEHREGVVEGFTKDHGVKTLVWYEMHGNAESALLREKRIKKWTRIWKLSLIESSNPQWDDLSNDLA
jgi:putative endonuclease